MGRGQSVAWGRSMMLAAQPAEPPWWGFVLFFAALLAVTLFARRRDAEDARRILRDDRAARCLGVLVIAFGLGVGYLVAYPSLAGAVAARGTILVPRGAVAASGLCLFVGLVLLAAGRHSERIFVAPEGRRPTPLQWGVVAAGTALALALVVGLELFLRAKGFRRF